MSLPKNLKTDFRIHDKGLVLAFALGPLAAVSNVAVSYILAFESCVRESKLLLHASSAAHFLLCALAAFLAWRLLSRFASLPPDDLRERMRWMANAAIVLAIGSALVVIATEIPNLILGSCD
jgi:hypothetical protein